MEHNHLTCSKEAHHSEQIKKKITTRLNKIEGQIRGINRMVSEDTYCDNILNQISAVQSALKGVSKLLLEAHINSCVVDQIQAGETEVIDELMTTINKMLK